MTATTATILPLDRPQRRVPFPAPPFDIDKMIAAAQRRASRLGAADRRFVNALAERRRLSGGERAALARIGDRLNLGAGDRG
ncbi:MAG TPA: hypothetical protein VHT00_01215 [Stellaceae bacterium]|jgi:hypothetical protein|nr:hypothetical protein [Stellaceae bacterium]